MTILPPDSICVLLTVDCLRAALPGLCEDEVMSLVRSRRLAPAFDLGLESKQLLRVVPSAIARFRAGERSRRRMLEDELFAEVLRGHTDLRVISGEQARTILNCTGGHINRLVDDGWLEVKPGTKRRRGPNGSDTITLASFKEFLKARIVS